MPRPNHTSSRTVSRTAARLGALGIAAACAAALSGCGSSSSIEITGNLYNQNGLPLTQNGQVADARVGGPAYGVGVGDALGIALHANPTSAADDGTRTAFVITDND